MKMKRKKKRSHPTKKKMPKNTMRNDHFVVTIQKLIKTWKVVR